MITFVLDQTYQYDRLIIQKNCEAYLWSQNLREVTAHTHTHTQTSLLCVCVCVCLSSSADVSYSLQLNSWFDCHPQYQHWSSHNDWFFRTAARSLFSSPSPHSHTHTHTHTVWSDTCINSVWVKTTEFINWDNTREDVNYWCQLTDPLNTVKT